LPDKAQSPLHHGEGRTVAAKNKSRSTDRNGFYESDQQGGNIAARVLLNVILDVINRELNGRDLLSFLIGNFSLKFLFQSHHQFDGVKGVGTEIFDERSGRLNILLFNAQLLSDDFLDAFFDAAHGFYRLLKGSKTVRRHLKIPPCQVGPPLPMATSHISAAGVSGGILPVFTDDVIRFGKITATVVKSLLEQQLMTCTSRHSRAVFHP
jgi:hypothetical protein